MGISGIIVGAQRPYDKTICPSYYLLNGMLADPAIPPKENSPQTDNISYTFPAVLAFPAGILQER